MKTVCKIGIQGIKKGLSAFVWMAKIIIPVSFFTALLSWAGIIEYITEVFKPFMSFLGLPSVSAIPLIAGALSSVYAGIAAMSVLPFKLEEMILIANFILICHNMIQETIIQANSGIKAWKTIGVRLFAATITVYVLKFFMKTSPSHIEVPKTFMGKGQPFWDMALVWATSTGRLVFKIFLIIMGIMVFLEFAKAYKWTDLICRLTRPFLKLMGLSERVGLLWMTAVVFGLAYGGAVIVEEAKNENIKKEELEALQLSVGINHSMVEDPSLFLPLGLPAFWLWVPRLITAMVATRIFAFLKNRRF